MRVVLLWRDMLKWVDVSAYSFLVYFLLLKKIESQGSCSLSDFIPAHVVCRGGAAAVAPLLTNSVYNLGPLQGIKIPGFSWGLLGFPPPQSCLRRLCRCSYMQYVCCFHMVQHMSLWRMSWCETVGTTIIWTAITRPCQNIIARCHVSQNTQSCNARRQPYVLISRGFWGGGSSGGPAATTRPTRVLNFYPIVKFVT